MSGSRAVAIGVLLCLVPAGGAAQDDAARRGAWEISARGTWSTLHHVPELVPGIFAGVFPSVTLPSRWPASEGGFGWEALLRRDLGGGFTVGLGAGDQRQALFTPSGLEDRGERRMDLFEVFAEASYRFRIPDPDVLPFVGMRAGRFALDGRIDEPGEITVETSGLDLGWFGGVLWQTMERFGLELSAMYSVYLMSEASVTGTTVVEGPAGDGTAIGARAGIVIRIP